MPKLCLKISTSEVKLIHQEDVPDSKVDKDNVLTVWGAQQQITATPSLCCGTCGEEVDGEDFVDDNNKLYCSEECMERERRPDCATKTSAKVKTAFLCRLFNRIKHE